MKGKFSYFDSNFTKYIPEGLIDGKSVVVQVMAWHQTGDKPLPEPMMTKTPYDVTRPPWVDTLS